MTIDCKSRGPRKTDPRLADPQLDQVRELLFGDHTRNLEARFAEIEGQLADLKGDLAELTAAQSRETDDRETGSNDLHNRIERLEAEIRRVEIDSRATIEEALRRLREDKVDLAALRSMLDGAARALDEAG